MRRLNHEILQQAFNRTVALYADSTRATVRSRTLATRPDSTGYTDKGVEPKKGQIILQEYIGMPLLNFTV